MVGLISYSYLISYYRAKFLVMSWTYMKKISDLTETCPNLVSCSFWFPLAFARYLLTGTISTIS
jgi:hypothetical protein